MKQAFSDYKVRLEVLFEDERPFATPKPIGLTKVVEARNTANAIEVAIECWLDNYPELSHDNILSAEVTSLFQKEAK